MESVRQLDAATQERLRGMDRDRLRELIPRAIDGRFRLHMPPQPDDDDLILAALIDEAIAGRALIAAAEDVYHSHESYYGVAAEEGSPLWDMGEALLALGRVVR